MKWVIAIVMGSGKKVWFEATDGTVYVSDPDNPHGLSGDLVTFAMDTGVLGKEILFLSKGPWCSNRRAMAEDTGFDPGKE